MKNLNIEQIRQKLEQRIQNDKFLSLKDLPGPDTFKDIKKATSRIISAINNKETITIVGDYDADGVASTAIMLEFFSIALGVKINHIIPNRFKDGYGVSTSIVDKINSGIIITVDNGISAIEAANICKQKSIDLIITDHHIVGEILPNAYAIVNPKQNDCNFPFKDICGAQVAWYLCASIKKELNLSYNLIQLFDFLTIAIVADVMPMVSLNKTLVKKGLNSILNSKRPAFIAIRNRFALNNNLSEDDIGFKIAPLINCAGRMDDANLALDFLLSFDEYEANEHLDNLLELNDKRKQEQLDMFEDAKSKVNIKDNVIIVSSDKWNEGILGIVASKLCDKYKKPSFVFKKKDNLFKASARSVGNINLYDLLSEVKDLTLGYGGHKGAAGVLVENTNMDEFKKQINHNIIDLPKEDRVLIQNIFCIINLDLINNELYNLINLYRPFGLDNLMPNFAFIDLNIINITKIGKSKQYQKIVVSNGNVNVDLLVFIDIDDFKIGETISFVACISKNEFRGDITYNLLFKELYIL